MPRFRGVFLACGLVAACAHPVAAQGSLGSERQDIRDFTGDIWSVWTAPLRTKQRDLLPTAGAIALTAITSRVDSATFAWMTSHPNTLVMRALGPIREGWKLPAYELGSGQFILPLAGLAYTAGRLSRSAAWRDVGLGCASGHLASLGFRMLIFQGVARTRPRVTPDPFQISFPGSKDWSRQSFTSGHISNSMACASFLGHRFSLGRAEPLPYMYSAAIGLGRMADGRHWASDTMAGALIGFAIGKTVAGQQLRRVASKESASANRAATPIPVFRWSMVF